MTRLIDLNRTLDTEERNKLPPQLAGAAKVFSPAIEYLHPAKDGADELCSYLGCSPSAMPCIH
jgi:hypothetical protein